MKTNLYELHNEIEMKHWWFQARRFITSELIQSILPPNRGESILDIGCGTGGNTAYLAHHYNIFGIDSSKDAINFAKKNWPEISFFNIDIIQLSKNSLKKLISKYRLILLLDVLEHLQNDSEILTNLIDVSKSGTYFLISVPAGANLWSEHDVNFGHYRRYELSTFKELWQSKPVTQLLLSYYNSRLYPFIKVIRFFNQKKGSSLGIAGTDLKLNARITNLILRNIFLGESRTLLGMLEGKRSEGYSKGVSLISVLQRL